MITATIGLTAAEAAARLAEYGPNELPEQRPPGLLRRAGHQLADPLALLLLAAAGISLVVLREVREGLAILAIVVLDAVVGAVQEHRADRAVAALRDLTAPSARVRRDGVVQHVAAAEVVPGDIVELAAGDRVPADLDLFEAPSLGVDESLLTGEAFPVEKVVGDGALAGTMIVRGRGVGAVVATGMHTELGRLAGAMTAAPSPPLVRELATVGRVMALLAVALGALLVPVAAWRGDGDDAFLDALLTGVSLAVAAIPEGLPAAVTASLALGAMRMARRGAIVRQLAAIEALGSTTVLCTDKTGTLTTGRLDVEEVEILPGREAAFWEAAMRCNDATVGGEDPMDMALLRAAVARGVSMPAGRRRTEQPFDAVTRTMAVVHETDHGPVLSVKGAPEAVLSRCAPSAGVDELARRAAEAAAEGRRVLVLADLVSDHADADGLRPLGLVTFADPLRASAVRAVEECRRAGIRVVLVTGDHPATAASVARAVGLGNGSTVTGAELAGLSVEQRGAALADATVVARVDPSVKVDLVAAHRARGDVVAMTGDGVNDGPALRQADVGVAVAGTAGTDVAREAADLVVTDEDLGTIVDAVREGRRVRRNLRGVVSYLVTGNLSEIAVVTAGVILLPDLAVPLLPVQLLWVNLVTDGLPALALGVDDPPGDLLGEPPRPPEERLLDLRRVASLSAAAAVVATGVLATALVARRSGWSAEQQRSQLVVSLVLAHLALAYVVRADRTAFGRGSLRNRVLLAAVGGSMALQLFVALVAPLRDWLGLVALPPRGWLTAAIAVLATVALLDGVRWAFRRR